MKLFAIAFVSSLLFISILFGQCSHGQTPASERKIHGISLVSPKFEIDSVDLAPIHELAPDWVAIIPYAFTRDNEANVRYDHDWQWWGERTQGTRRQVQLAHAQGLKVMLKPHVWLWDSWIGDYKLSSEDEWLQWANAYRSYLMSHAIIAQQEGVEMLCIGTEYRHAVEALPDFWIDLADSVRTFYEGKLTYAANWDDYEQVSFWHKLDYIGIDAYFPLVKEKTPTLAEVKKAWDPIILKLQAFSQEQDKPILFTEYGYQSAHGALGEHWNVKPDPENVNENMQVLGYQALYETVWGNPWMAGGFLWKWHYRRSPENKRLAATFTPQNKKASKVIRYHYGK